MIEKQFLSVAGHEEITNNFKKEIYEENEYNRFNIFVEPGDIVLDAGANVGIFTQYALDLGASLVLSYEADENIFECYTQNIQNERVKPTLGFVGDKDFSLNKILSQHNIEKINFAKIDIEGSEWDLFKNMSSLDLNKVDKWAIEFHTNYHSESFNDESKKNYLWNLLHIIELFSLNNYNVYFEHIHKDWDVVHLFAVKKTYN
jgi:tRNA G37 N-methylase Trm5